MKYEKSELQELSKSVFASQPGDEVVYANSEGTFLNQDQYDALDEDDQDEYVKFENPNAPKKKVSSEEKSGVKKLQSEVAELKEELKATKKQLDVRTQSEQLAVDENADLKNQLGDSAKALQKSEKLLQEKDASIEKLKAEIEKLKNPSK